MSSAALCGSGGSITTIAGVTEVTNWNFDRTVDSIDATSMSSSGWKEKVACLKKGSGSFTSIGAPAAVGAASGVFKVSATGNSISSAIIITEVTTNTPVDGIVSFNHSFVSTGTITAT